MLNPIPTLTVTPASPASTLSLFTPRLLLTRLGLGLMWCVAQLPFGLQRMLGQGLGWLLRVSARRRRHITRVNLALCFPERSNAQRETLLRAHFQSLGMAIVETAMCWWTPSRRLQPLLQLTGLEHLQAALQAGRGVILLSAHFTTLEIGGRLLSLRTPFHVLYRAHKNPVFEAVMKRAREAHFDTAIARDDMRGMLRSLKANMPVWYAPDQDFGREQAVFVPFFGIPAATLTATSRLARISGAAVVPFFPRRLPDGRGYALELLPALTDFPSADERADAARINTLIEAQVRNTPEQYLWAHRRFKTRPEGEADVYA